ncbi:MAG: hypothetical protein JWM68_1360 [Verrucomicrobiales bacterium]|nr:hypothetical protein [Verrucomicrobiales bacterium]
MSSHWKQGTEVRVSKQLKEKDNIMDNPITENPSELLGSAVLVKTAIEEFGAGIPLVQNTTANVGADIDALTTAVNSVETGKTALTALTASRLVEEAIVEVVREYMLVGRDMLKPHLGREYNPAYEAIGLVGTSAVPYTGIELQPILQNYKAFFTGHPLLEDVGHNITAAHAQELYDELLAARTDVNTKSTQLQILRGLRNAATKKLRKRMRAVLNELDFALDPMDARYTAFGFNKPGAQALPEIPANLMAILIGPNAVAMKWNAASRAEYYRVYKRVIGVDAEPVAVGSPADLDFTLENLPANATVEVYISAVNSGGESALSEKVTIVTH